MGRLIGTRKCDLYRAEYDTGKTYREIAAEYGVSFQAVQQAATKERKECSCRCIWEGLACWMEENDVSVKELAKKIGASYSSLRAWMIGKNDPSKRYIDALLKLTGWSYEDLFCEE